MDRLTLITLAAHQPRRAISRHVEDIALYCAGCLTAAPDSDDRLPSYCLPWRDWNLQDICVECRCKLEFTPIKPSLKEPTP